MHYNPHFLHTRTHTHTHPPPLPPGQPVWHPYLTRNGQHLDVSLSYPSVLWPWSGYLAVSLSVAKDGRSFSGEAEGHVSLTVASSTVSNS